MKTTLKMVATTIKALLFLLSLNLVFSCTNNKSTSTGETAQKMPDTLVIIGTVNCQCRWTRKLQIL
jgi:hypothetical protein